MSPFRRRFISWAAALAAVWAFANLPRDGGTLKSFFSWAGFPWTFARWTGDRLDGFDAGSLAADIGLGLVVVLGVAAACAWSRGRASRSPGSGAVPAPPPDPGAVSATF